MEVKHIDMENFIPSSWRQRLSKAHSLSEVAELFNEAEQYDDFDCCAELKEWCSCHSAHIITDNNHPEVFAESNECELIYSTSTKKWFTNNVSCKSTTNTAVADLIYSEAKGIGRMILLALGILVIVLIIALIFKDSIIGNRVSRPWETPEEILLYDRSFFWHRLWKIAKHWGKILLLITIFGRYLVLGIKWVRDNKSK